MPAHFTSGQDGRTKSFCVDYDISPEQEYELASEAYYRAWHELKGDAVELSSQAIDVIGKVGEDVILASFIAAKENCEDLIDEVSQMIVDENIVRFQKKGVEISDWLNNKASLEHLERCKRGGVSVAKGAGKAPENSES